MCACGCGECGVCVCEENKMQVKLCLCSDELAPTNATGQHVCVGLSTCIQATYKHVAKPKQGGPPFLCRIVDNEGCFLAICAARCVTLGMLQITEDKEFSQRLQPFI